MQEFKRLVGGVADGGAAKSEGGLGLSDFADLFDAVPPGAAAWLTSDDRAPPSRPEGPRAQHRRP